MHDPTGKAEGTVGCDRRHNEERWMSATVRRAMYALLPSRLLRPKLVSRHSGDAPVLQRDFIDDHERGRRALVEHPHHEVGHSGDQLRLLRFRRAFARDLDVDVRHVSSTR